MSQDAIVLRAERWVDVDAGQVRKPAVVVVEGERIAAVNPAKPPANARVIGWVHQERPRRRPRQHGPP